MESLFRAWHNMRVSPSLFAMRRIWQLAILTASGALLFLAFKGGTLDRASMSLFYNAADPSQPWSAGNAVWAKICYQAAPILTAAIALFSLACILFPKWFRCLNDARMAGILLLLSTALGPGLFVNAVFKEHWGRPRPRDTADFGGNQPYVPAFVFNHEGKGKSFPCGHCSVGFVLAAPALLLASKRAKYALIAFAIALGMVMGFARMAAGGHFLSDVLAAGWITFSGIWIATLLLPLRRGQRGKNTPDAPPLQSWWKRHPITGSLIATAAAIGMGIGALFAIPFEQSHLFVLFESDVSRLSAGVTPHLAIQTNIENLHTRITPLPDGELFRFQGVSRGFGTPGNRVLIRTRVVSPFGHHHAGISLIMEESGQFTELSHDVSLLVAPHVNIQIENAADISLDNRKVSPQ